MYDNEVIKIRHMNYDSSNNQHHLISYQNIPILLDVNVLIKDFLVDVNEQEERMMMELM
jgi:hypothetical protein